MKKEEQMKGFTALFITALVWGLSAGFFTSEKMEYAENENRYLAEAPDLNWNNIKTGRYMQDAEAYLSDHFLFRDFFMGMKTQMELAVGKKEINSIYFAEDGYLIEKYHTPQNTERIAETLKNFSEKLGKHPIRLRLMLIPTAVWVYEAKLPEYAPSVKQMETAEAIYESSGIPGIDCKEELLAFGSEEELYYKTDHHWTTLGAYEGYRSFCREMGWDAVGLDAMEAQTVTEDFCGTLCSKAGDYFHKGDSVTIYTNPSDTLKVEYKDTGEISDSLYNLDYVNHKDKYSLFLDNLHPLIEITNARAVNGGGLALIKDSYANSMVPYLIHHYKKVYVFDTRYYKEGPSAFIKEHPEITDVLILYNMNTLDTDAGIRGIF